MATPPPTLAMSATYKTSLGRLDLSPWALPSMRAWMSLPHAAHGEHLSFAERSSWGKLERHGCIEIVCGSMFSGKTEELLRRVKRARLARQHVVLFKPRIDNRYDDVKVVSHEGIKAEATAVSSSAELLKYLNLENPPDVVG